MNFKLTLVLILFVLSLLWLVKVFIRTIKNSQKVSKTSTVLVQDGIVNFNIDSFYYDRPNRTVLSKDANLDGFMIIWIPGGGDRRASSRWILKYGGRNYIFAISKHLDLNAPLEKKYTEDGRSILEIAEFGLCAEFYNKNFKYQTVYSVKRFHSMEEQDYILSLFKAGMKVFRGARRKSSKRPETVYVLATELENKFKDGEYLL